MRRNVVLAWIGAAAAGLLIVAVATRLGGRQLPSTGPRRSDRAAPAPSRPGKRPRRRPADEAALASYAGVVVDGETGEPIEGARVSLLYADEIPHGLRERAPLLFEAITDSGGRFRIEEDLPPGTYSLAAGKPEAPYLVSRDLVPLARLPRVIRLRPRDPAHTASAVLEGRIFDEDGALYQRPCAIHAFPLPPLPSISTNVDGLRLDERIEVHGAIFGKIETTTANGVFRLGGLEPGTIAIKIGDAAAERKGKPFRFVETRIPLAPGVNRRDFHLVLGAAVTGTVTRLGAPAPGIRVEVSDLLADGKTWVGSKWAYSNEGGGFVVRFVSPGTKMVEFSGRDVCLVPWIEFPLEKGEVHDLGFVEVGEAAAVRVRLHDRDGRPVPDTNVQLCGERILPCTSCRSDENGEARLCVGREGAYAVTVVAEHCDAVRVPAEEPTGPQPFFELREGEEKEIEVELPCRPSVSIHLTVAYPDPGSDEPVWLLLGRTGKGKGSTSQLGPPLPAYDFTDLAEGDFDLLLIAGDTFAHWRGHLDAPAEIAIAASDFRRGRSLEGRLVDPEGRPVRRHEVTVAPSRNPSGFWHLASLSDRWGKFRFRGLPTDVDLRLSIPGAAEPIPVPAGDADLGDLPIE